MQIEFRALSEIRPYEKNPRKNDAAVAAVAQSIREFGFRQPIVVDEAGVIVVGHTRYKAAQMLGLATVPDVAAYFASRTKGLAPSVGEDFRAGSPPSRSRASP
jgi:ParB-like chromosome segregation protein Spo0J